MSNQAQRTGREAMSSCTPAASVSSSSSSADLLGQLRQVLMSAEQQSFEVESYKRKLNDEQSELSKLKRLCEEKASQMEASEGKLRELQLFADQQKDHICRLQKNLSDEKKVKSGYEMSMNALRLRVDELDNQLKTKQNDIEKLHEQGKEKLDAQVQLGNEIKTKLEESNKMNGTLLEQIEECKKQNVTLQKVAQNAQEEGKKLQAKLKSAYREAHVSGTRETELAEQNRCLRNEVSELSRTNSSLREESGKMRAQFEQIEAELSKERQRLVEMEASHENLKTRFTQAKQERAQSDEMYEIKLQHVENKLHTVEREKQSQKMELEGLLSKVGHDIEDLKAARISEINKEREMNDKNVRGLGNRIKILQETIEERQRLLAAKESEVKQLFKERAGLRSQVENLAQKLKHEEQGHRVSKTQLSKALQEKEKMEKEISKKSNTSKVELTRALKAKERSDKAVTQLEQENERKIQQLKSLQGSLEQDRKNWKATEADLCSQLSNANELIRDGKELREKLQEELNYKEQNYLEKVALLQSKIKELQNYGSKQVSALKEKLARTEKLLEKARAEASELESSHSVLLKELSEVKSTSKNQLCDIEHELGEARINVEKLTGQIQTLQAELSRRNRDFAQEQQRQAKLYHDQLHSLTNENEKNKKKIRMVCDRNSKLESEKETIQQSTAGQIIGFNEKSKALYKENETLRGDVTRLESKLQLAVKKEESALKTILEQRQELERVKRDLTERCSNLDKELQQVSRERSSKEMELVKLQHDFEEEKRQLQCQSHTEREELHSAMEGVRWKADTLAREVEELRAENRSLNEKYNIVSRENQNLQESETRLIDLYKSMTNSSGGSLADEILEQPETEEEEVTQTRPKKNSSTKKKKVFRKKKQHPRKLVPVKNTNNQREEDHQIQSQTNKKLAPIFKRPVPATKRHDGDVLIDEEETDDEENFLSAQFVKSSLGKSRKSLNEKQVKKYLDNLLSKKSTDAET